MDIVNGDYDGRPMFQYNNVQDVPWEGVELAILQQAVSLD